MEVYEAVRTALAVRKFQDQPLPPESVRRILEAGWLTGSSMNGQPWHFILIDDRQQLHQVAALARTGPYIAEAAAAVAVVIEHTPYAVSDGSRAIQSMILTAWAEGIGSNWVGFMGPEELKPLLNVPAERDILGVVALGYPVKKLGSGRKKRKEASEVFSHGRFGEPLHRG